MRSQGRGRIGRRLPRDKVERPCRNIARPAVATRWRSLMHRHERPRPPAHDKPRLMVAGFLREQPPELEQTKWGFVYDAYLLYRTWALAGTEPVWHLPGDIDRLVQEIYSYEPFAEEERAEYQKNLNKALGEHLAEIQDHRQRAVNAALDSEAEPQLAYVNKPRGAEDGEGLGLRAVTRLGDDGIAVVPVLEAEDGWRLFATDVPFDLGVMPDDALARRIYRRQVRLSRKDIVKALTAQPAPIAFDTHPLLRNLKAMPLQNGVTDVGKLRVRLDRELGIVYETIASATEGA